MIKRIPGIVLFLFTILTSQACGEVGEKPFISEAPVSEKGAITNLEVSVSPPPVEIDVSAREIKIPAVVQAHKFNNYTGQRSQFFVIMAMEEGTAVFVSHVSPLEVHRALMQIGGRPGDNLSRPPFFSLPKDLPDEERFRSIDLTDEKVEGSPIQISVTWAGGPKEYLLQELIADSGGKGVAMRFGGNLLGLQERIKRGLPGIVACFFSCPGGVIGNEEYSMRGMMNKKGRIVASENLLPSDGTAVTLTLKLKE